MGYTCRGGEGSRGHVFLTITFTCLFVPCTHIHVQHILHTHTHTWICRDSSNGCPKQVMS